MGIYDTLGVQPVINAAGPVTRLSGAPLHPEVAAAMAEAAQHCFRIEDLQAAAGRYLAEVTGAEAGYVTAGAAAGLSLSAAAAIAGLDVAAMDRLPDTTGLRDEIVVQRAHLTAYTHALRLAGAKLVEVGYLGFPGQGITWPWQVEAAVNERTAALAWSVGSAQGVVPLEEMVAIGRRHRLPVIVDAAASLPPVENLQRFIAAGADLVAFSGGKAIGGPQASGILVGRADLIESVALQHQDMDVYPETWTWRERYIASGRLPGPPHHGIGRPLKVGKEEIAGLVVALRRFLVRDHLAERREQEERLAAIIAGLDGIPGVESELLDDSRAPRPYPTLVIRIDETIVEQPVETIVNALADGDPPICVSQNFLHERALGIVATTLKPGDEATIAGRLREVLRGA
ncbi:MAG TPA: aminotransferase class V-fold PLP-dependent enzyme [Thermomicrobiales bacterium]|nr:aminotransferase class V-fold PLP-dependent enzyme [Thermomicrobiales bacterium]